MLLFPCQRPPDLSNLVPCSSKFFSTISKMITYLIRILSNITSPYTLKIIHQNPALQLMLTHRKPGLDFLVAFFSIQLFWAISSNPLTEMYLNSIQKGPTGACKRKQIYVGKVQLKICYMKHFQGKMGGSYCWRLEVPWLRYQTMKKTVNFLF